MKLEFGIAVSHVWLSFEDHDHTGVIQFYDDDKGKMQLYTDGLTKVQVKQLINQVIDDAEILRI